MKMKINKILILMIAFLFSLLSVNAVTILNNCGTPNSGWLNNELYVVNLTTVSKATQTNLNYCFDLNTVTSGITFQSNNQINLVDMTMFRIDTQNTNLNIQNFDIISTQNPKQNLFVEYYNSLSSGTQIVNLGNTFRNIKFTDNVNVDKNIFFFGSTFAPANSQRTITYDNFNLINSEINAKNLNLVSFNNPIVGVNGVSTNYRLYQILNLNNNGNLLNVKRLSNNVQGSVTWTSGYSCIIGNCVSQQSTLYSNSGKTNLIGSNSVLIPQLTNSYYILNISNSMIKGKSFQDLNVDGFADNSSIYDSSIIQLSNMRTYLELFNKMYIQDITVSPALQNLNNLNIIDLNGWSGQGVNGHYFDFLNGIGNTISCDISNYLNIAGPFGNLKSNNLNGCSLTFNSNTYNFNLQNRSGYIEVLGGNSILNNIFTVSSSFNLSLIQNLNPTMSGIDIIGNTFSKTINGLNNYKFINIKPTQTTRIQNNVFQTSSTGSLTYIDLNNAQLQNGQKLIITGNTFSNVNQQLDKTLLSNYNNVNLNTEFYNNYVGKNLKFNNTPNFKLNGQKKYFVSGVLYTFNVGNFYEANVNCVDANADGICDSPYIFNGVVDNYPLSSYPFNYAQHIISAISYTNVNVNNFSVSILSPTNNQNIIVDSISKTYNLQFQHTLNVNVDKCDIYLNNVIYKTIYDVNNGVNSVSLNGLLNGNSYVTKVSCSIGTTTQQSSNNVFSVTYGTVPIDNGGGINNGGGGGSGGGSPNPIINSICQEGTFKTKICSQTRTIDEFICSNGDWKATGYSCGTTCNWYDLTCSNTQNQSISDRIISFLPIINRTINAIPKKICNIDITPKSLSFSKDGELNKFTITNNEVGSSYTPDYKIVSGTTGKSAIQSLSVANVIGTLSSGSSVDVGVKYTVGTFTPDTSSDNLVLISSSCADVEVPITTNNNNLNFINNKLGGSSFGNIPNLKSLSSLLNSSSSIPDLLLYSILGGVFTSLNYKKKFVKGVKNKRKNLIVKSLIIGLWTLFSSVVILVIANLVL